MHKRKETIKAQIKQIYDDSYLNYEAPKITQIIKQNGEIIAEKTVGNYMREMGLKAQYTKPYTTTTKDSNFIEKLINILNEEFNPEEPNAVWCSDITYIWTYDGFVYLTSIMDLYSRKIISWILSTTLESKWVIKAIERAKASRKINKPLYSNNESYAFIIFYALALRTRGVRGRRSFPLAIYDC
ncbi:DDE-type integrase/transposase/recombinase [Clostridium algidicarnis]|uniref:DDE-type integrase/transposase/recombinase n=1 Tax=Clostridium algidicarnis TaxID=37659 RepID=UPI001C0AC488|nr:DDE-type integrase/transposase/recombinase [Clostridium algidicarnis]MBU3207727.1 DDE-type integrase/transposase/recombinase [Clostridium algidicarnis]